MDMAQTMKFHVLGARRGSVDGNRYAALYVAQPAPESDPDNIGMQVMKVSCPHDLLDHIPAKSLPGDFEAEALLKPAAGGKMGIEVRALRPAPKAAPKA